MYPLVNLAPLLCGLALLLMRSSWHVAQSSTTGNLYNSSQSAQQQMKQVGMLTMQEVPLFPGCTGFQSLPMSQGCR